MLALGNKINLNLDLDIHILDELYYSPITKRGLYKVYNNKLGSYYALKVYDLELNDLKDIDNEIISYNKNANNLNFPKIHFKMKKNNLVYIFMDWIDGKTLTSFFKRKAIDSFELKKRLSYCIELCYTLNKIHKVNIIHRDLKPDNIMINNPTDIKNSMSIIDFGLSASNRRPEEGTPVFQSPEQELGIGIIGRWSDLYALGQIFHYILHGKTIQLIANDDYNDWINIELEILQVEHDKLLYEKLLYSLLSFNSKKRPKNLYDIINKLKSLQRSIK